MASLTRSYSANHVVRDTQYVCQHCGQYIAKGDPHVKLDDSKGTCHMHEACWQAYHTAYKARHVRPQDPT